MTARVDAQVYQRALAELRRNHLKEFETIRHRLLRESGLDVKPYALMAITVEDYLNKHFDKEYTIQELARGLKYNRESVRKRCVQLAKAKRIKVRLTKRQQNIPPKKYYASLRFSTSECK